MTIYPFESSSASPQANKKPRKPHSVTGRDHSIIAQALIRFIATEQEKPDHLQQWSNLQDTRAIFNACCGANNVVWFESEYPGVTISLVDEKAPRDHSD